MQKKFLCVICFLMSCAGFSATMDIESLVNESFKKFNVPGVAVGIVADNQIILCRGFGMRNLEKGLPVTHKTLFAIASCTKGFTTSLLGQLVDEGRISWDDPVVTYIPEFRLFNPQLTHGVTIRDLVSHRTGIPRHDAIWFCTKMGRTTDILNCIAHLEPVCDLREKWYYNNFMYTVAGMIIERVTGQTWEEAISSRLFIPLGMSSSNLCIEQSQCEDDYSLAYAEVDGTLSAIPFRNCGVISPGGAINSNLVDMLRWVEFQLSDGKMSKRRLIQKKTLDEMHILQIPIRTDEREEIGFSQRGYGLGWFIGSYEGHMIINHGGSFDGFMSEISLLPEKNLGIVILTNSSTDGRYAIASIRNTILDTFLGLDKSDWIAIVQEKRKKAKEDLIVEKNGEKTLPPRLLSEYVGIYEHPSYGTVRIHMQNRQLCACYGDLTFPLEYQKDGLFQAQIRELLVYGMKRLTDFAFIKDQADSPDRVEISFEPAAKPIAFKRVVPMSFPIDEKGKCRIEDAEYPAVGFGTYPLKGETCSKALTRAAESGYRIIDTATFYGNFAPIGKVLKKFGREHFYVISKVWPDSQTPEGLQDDLKRTLEQLQTTYLDAYLLHWPNSKIPIEVTLHEMEKLRNAGLIRHIGLSNVNINHLKRALEVQVPISWVQVEMHPLFFDPELLEFCKKYGITVQAWAPLSRGRISKDAILTKIGKKYGKTASQVALRWILQHGCVPLPGSHNEKHMQQNLHITDFALSQLEMQELDARAKMGKRERVTEEMGLGFADEFDYSYEECWPKS